MPSTCKDWKCRAIFNGLVSDLFPPCGHVSSTCKDRKCRANFSGLVSDLFPPCGHVSSTYTDRKCRVIFYSPVSDYSHLHAENSSTFPDQQCRTIFSVRCPPLMLYFPQKSLREKLQIPRSLLHQNRIDYADTALAILIAGTQKMSLLQGQISVTFHL